MTAAAMSLLSVRLRRIVVHCELLEDLFNALAQLYGFCESAFCDPLQEMKTSTQKYARWLRVVSFGSFALTGTRPAWAQELRAQWQRHEVKGPDADLLPDFARWWSERSFGDTLHVRFRRDVCIMSLRLILWLNDSLPFFPMSGDCALPLWGPDKLLIKDEVARLAAICWLLFLLRRFGPYLSSTDARQATADTSTGPTASLNVSEEEVTKARLIFQQLQQFWTENEIDPYEGHLDPATPGLIDKILPLLGKLAQCSHLIDVVILETCKVLISGPTTTKEELLDLPHPDADIILAISTSPRGFSKGDILKISAPHLSLKRLLLFAHPAAKKTAAYTHAELQAMKEKGLIQYHSFDEPLRLSWPTSLDDLKT